MLDLNANFFAFIIQEVVDLLMPPFESTLSSHQVQLQTK